MSTPRLVASAVALTLLVQGPAVQAQLKPKVPAWAQVKAVKTVLFPLVNKTIPTLTQEVVGLAKGLGQQVQPSSLSPDEVMLAVGCNSYSVACLQQIGKMIKAPALILGKVKPLPTGGLRLELRRFDVATGGDAGKAAGELPLTPVARRTKLLTLLRALFGVPEPAPPKPRKKVDGELVITCSTANATVFLDGQRRGAAPLVLASLPPGVYRVSATKRGYFRWEGKVKVMAGGVHRLRIMLQRETAARTSSPGFFGTIQPQTWIVGGVGLVSLAVGIGFAAHMGSQQNEFDRIEGNTPFEIAQLQDLKDTGERDAIVANVMFAVGGALLATAAVLGYLDYRHGSNSERLRARRKPKQAKRARLQIGLGSVRYSF
jgi:hypothetical protein